MSRRSTPTFPLDLGLLTRALLAAAALGVGAGAAAGQEAPSRTRVWLDLGLADGTGGGVEEGLGLLAQVSYQRRPHYLGLRVLGLSEFKSFPDGGDGSVGDFGLLYGRSGIASWGHATVAGGLAWVDFHDCPDDPGRDGCGIVGFPLMAEAAVESSVVGLGLQVFADLNAGSSFAGASLFVQLGWTP